MTDARGPDARYTLLALLFTVLWASAFIVVKFALRYTPPIFLMGSRFLVAGAAMLAWARGRGAPLPATLGEWRPIAVLGLLNNACYLGLTALALQHISAGLGAVLASTNPLLLALVAPWALGERLTAAKAGGLLLSFAGVITVMWNRLGADNRPLGMVLALASVGCLVTGTVLFKRWRPAQDLLVLNGGQVLASGVALIVPSVALEPVARVQWWEPAFVLPWLHLVVGMSGAAMLIWFWLLRHGDATRASAWFFLSPVLGLFMGAAALGEPLAAVDFVGSAAVAAGLYVVQRA